MAARWVFIRPRPSSWLLTLTRKVSAEVAICCCENVPQGLSSDKHDRRIACFTFLFFDLRSKDLVLNSTITVQATLGDVHVIEHSRFQSIQSCTFLIKILRRMTNCPSFSTILHSTNGMRLML
uniref:Putative secreted protein n=1 Tax=Anopheles darlingi TaxID=43151 RepID=A0A2M4DFL6_ANODA